MTKVSAAGRAAPGSGRAMCHAAGALRGSRPREECERFDWSRAGKMWPIFPGTDLSVLIGREAIFADREASRDASLNAHILPPGGSLGYALGRGRCGHIRPRPRADP